MPSFLGVIVVACASGWSGRLASSGHQASAAEPPVLVGAGRRQGEGCDFDRLRRPARLQAGQILIAAVVVLPAERSSGQATGGWKLLRRDSSAARGAALAQSLYYRVASARELTTFRWRFPRSRSAVAGLLVYGRADSGRPVLGHSGRSARNSRRVVAPLLVTRVPGARVVGFFTVSGQTRLRSPGGTTKRYKVASSGRAGMTSSGADMAKATAGPVARRTASTASARASSSASSWRSGRRGVRRRPRLPHHLRGLRRRHRRRLTTATRSGPPTALDRSDVLRRDDRVRLEPGDAASAVEDRAARAGRAPARAARTRPSRDLPGAWTWTCRDGGGDDHDGELPGRASGRERRRAAALRSLFVRRLHTRAGFVLQGSPFTSYGGNTPISTAITSRSPATRSRQAKDQGLYSDEDSATSRSGPLDPSQRPGDRVPESRHLPQGNDHLLANNVIHDHPPRGSGSRSTT